MRVEVSAAELSQTLDVVYACAASPSRVGELLHSLGSLFRSHFADTFARRHDGSQASGMAIGLDHADYTDGMIATWSSRNPWGRAAPVVSAGDVRATWQFLPRDELARSEMFADYLDRRDLHEGLRFEIWSDQSGIEDLSLLRSSAIGPFTPDELALGRLLMPHLQRAAWLRRRLQGAELATQAGLQALETLQHGVVFVDRTGRPTFVNAAAEALLAGSDAVAVVGRRVDGNRPIEFATARRDVAPGRAHRRRCPGRGAPLTFQIRRAAADGFGDAGSRRSCRGAARPTCRHPMLRSGRIDHLRRLSPAVRTAIRGDAS